MPNIPHSFPFISSREAWRVSTIVRSHQLVQGKFVRQFETKVARYINMKDGVAVNSGTSALHLALLALGVKKNHEVIIPTYVCTALLNAVHYVGALPKIVDVDYVDGNISVAAVKKAITRKTKAIIVPHMFGRPADIKALKRLSLPIIEDCAQSIGAKVGKRRVGGFGDISICSFYATKMLTTGEGGMICSKNKRLLDHCRDLREYDNKGDYKVRFNYKMTDIQAGLGLEQLKNLPQYIKRRKELAKLYHKYLAEASDKVQLPIIKGEREHVYFRYVIKVKKKRNALMNALKKKGIGCASPVYKPLHKYVSKRNCPTADELMKQDVSLPIFPRLKERDVKHICQMLIKFINR